MHQQNHVHNSIFPSSSFIYEFYNIRYLKFDDSMADTLHSDQAKAQSTETKFTNIPINSSTHNVSMSEDNALEKRVTRKVDVRVVPMLCALYLTAYLDRTNIGNAKLLRLESELNMPSDGYNTAVWIFFLTFVLMEVPSNLLMAHSAIPPNYWLGISMSLLGIVTMCQGFVQGPSSLYACRAIMGVFEGSLGPAAALMMGSYYRKHEFPLRYCCFTTSALIGASFSSVNLDAATRST